MSIWQKGLQHWIPYYLWDVLFQKQKIDPNQPAHIFLCVVDHYEPFHGGCDFERARNRVQNWVEEYPRMAEKHRDSDGKPPQHTWFYPPHLDHIFLKDLVRLCKKGFGEIEMHMHHNHMSPFPDTSQTLKQKILKCINDYSQYGIFCLPDGEKTFAFIHGDWSLDNSRGDSFCGVNDEITILKECGCYADFTFPSLGSAQPAMVNKMYYVSDNPQKAKSYNWGRPVKTGQPSWGDLMLIQGIIGLRWQSRVHRYTPSIEESNLHTSECLFSRRIDYWIKNAIRIDGQPNWLFIKLHTHGCREIAFDSLLGKKADEMFSYLENNFCCKDNYYLHYVTAREMYNIIKAVESGCRLYKGSLRNTPIPQYLYV